MRSIVSRAKRESKRSVLTDGRGVPVAGVLDGANRNHHTLMRETLDAIALPRPKTMPGCPQHLCLDKGYDPAEPREIAAEFGFTLHLRTCAPAVRRLRPSATPEQRRAAGSWSAHIPGSTASAPS